MKTTCIPTKELYWNPLTNYRIVSCVPSYTERGITVNKYGNFTLCGDNLKFIQIDKRYDLDIEPDTNSKYPHTYKLIGFSNISTNNEQVVVDVDAECKILSRFMTEQQARNVHEIYPHFVQDVLNQQTEKISHKNIKNVGPKRLQEYFTKIQEDYQYILFWNTCTQYGITENKAINLAASEYDSIEQFIEELKSSPYYTLIKKLDIGFISADKKILNHFPEFKVSDERCKYLILHLLHKHVENGHTRIQAEQLAKIAWEYAPELVDLIPSTITKCDEIYYDSNTQYASIRLVYQQEQYIADEILRRVNQTKTPLSISDWKQFTTVDGFTCTDEQSQILKYIAEGHHVLMLSGSAGCVDCDTEFFNGYEWKRIADYEKGDKVLQYNDDGTAELVEPIQYIKQPCDTLWHFETKYGINQTLCDEHTIVYWSAKNSKHICNIQEIIDQQQKNGWHGYFETSFKYDGSGINLSDIEIKLMCAVICDGSFCSALPNNFTCRFHIKKERKKERLKNIFKEYGKPYREVKSAADGYTDFYIEAPRREKYFTAEWYNCSQHQLQIICDNILFWDGNESYTAKGKRRLRFSTTIKETADFVQFAFSACGYRANILIKDRTGQQYFTNNKLYVRKSIEYNVTITNRHRVGLCSDNRLNHKKTIPQQVPTIDGYKYCFTVPSSMLVLRRKENIFITGNCGKTSSVKALINMLEHMYIDYTMVAPTGIAAKRLRISTGRTASTIHMLLVHHEPVGKYVIVDEFSMIGVGLLYDLLNYTPNDTNLIFVCDEAQLASISYGNVLYDIIKSGKVPRINLTKVFRYGTNGIATIATDIRNGNIDHIHQPFDDFKFINNTAQTYETIENLYRNCLSNGYKDEDILILTPQNKGQYGTYNINNFIQKIHNPNESTGVIKHPMKNVDVEFKLNDIVLNTHNEYNVLTKNDTMAVMNGDIGRLVTYDKQESKTTFEIVFDTGTAYMSNEQLNNLLLGYAMTIHKVQGSQNKVVIVIVDDSHKHMLSRNLLYVAASRAQEKLYIIANENTLKDALQIEETHKRDTWLFDLLTQERGE